MTWQADFKAINNDISILAARLRNGVEDVAEAETDETLRTANLNLVSTLREIEAAAQECADKLEDLC